jgi:hypothetical protein
VAQPFRLVGVALQVEPRHEGLVAADDHHDQQVRDHHHVDQAEHRQHDRLFGDRESFLEQVPQFLEEQDDVDALRHDEAEIERKLQPARGEDQQRERSQAAIGRDGRFGSHAHGGITG